MFYHIAATSSSFRPAVDGRTFNRPGHSYSQGPTNVQQNCSPLVPNYHQDSPPLRDQLHSVPIYSIDIAEFERYDLYDPPAPSSPNHPSPLLEQSPYNISYANQPRLHQEDGTTPVTLPDLNSPGLPYASAPLTTQRPRSILEQTNAPLSATSACPQTQIQSSIQPPSMWTTYHDFGGPTPTLSVPPVPLATANPATNHSNISHHFHRVVGGSLYNATMWLGTVRSARQPYVLAPLTTTFHRSLPELTEVPLGVTSEFHQTQVQASIQLPPMSTTSREFEGIAPALSAPPVPLTTAAADHSNLFHHSQCKFGGSPCNATILGAVRSVHGPPYDPAPLMTQPPRSPFEPTDVPPSFTSASFHQTRIPASIQPPLMTAYHGLLGTTTAPPTPPAADNSNTFYHCQCVTAANGLPCNARMLGTVRSVRDHLNRTHGFRGDGKEMVYCLWQGCTSRLQRESIPRHIRSCHLRAGVRCIRCGQRLSRSDVQYSHARVCREGRPASS